jgi:bisphosphoglycerate-independent phosphoglycerate mutase (AlkP superfamily)
MGNSEVGHITMGAGRVVYQDLTRIDKSVRDGDFFEKPALVEAIARCKDGKRALHLIGLVSPNGIHSHTRHLTRLSKWRHVSASSVCSCRHSPTAATHRPSAAPGSSASSSV